MIFSQKSRQIESCYFFSQGFTLRYYLSPPRAQAGQAPWGLDFTFFYLILILTILGT